MDQVAEITVKGYGTARAMPDAIDIGLSVASQHKDYTHAIEGLNTKVSSINAALANSSCTEKATTKSYGVSEVWTDKYDSSKRQFQGYLAIQKLGVVDFAYKLSQHFGPILSHWFKDIFAYSIVDKSTSLACS